MNKEQLKHDLASPVMRLVLNGTHMKFEEFSEEEKADVLNWVDYQLMPQIEAYMKEATVGR